MCSRLHHFRKEIHLDSSAIGPGIFTIISGISGGIIFAIVLISIVLYFLPWFIALKIGHPNTIAIFFLNLLLGWCIFGWVAALIWALARPHSPMIQHVYHMAPGQLPPHPQASVDGHEVYQRTDDGSEPFHNPPGRRRRAAYPKGRVEPDLRR
jgi:Superinfection immunity protein